MDGRRVLVTPTPRSNRTLGASTGTRSESGGSGATTAGDAETPRYGRLRGAEGTRRGECGLGTLEWILIVAAAGGLAALGILAFGGAIGGAGDAASPANEGAFSTPYETYLNEHWAQRPFAEEREECDDLRAAGAHLPSADPDDADRWAELSCADRTTHETALIRRKCDHRDAQWTHARSEWSVTSSTDGERIRYSCSLTP